VKRFDVEGFKYIQRFLVQKIKKAVGFFAPTALTIEIFQRSIHGRTSGGHHGHPAGNVRYGLIVFYHGITV